MQYVRRPALQGKAQQYVEQKQKEADIKSQQGKLDVASMWDGVRKAKSFRPVLQTLGEMTKRRERCMYCVDSHGSDVEHFWPKVRYPERAFVWHNMLLCCTECGRLKGHQFPLQNNEPLLIDPSTEDPWRHLDFDPDTGNLIAKYCLETNDVSIKGEKTVEIFHLDRREALSEGYQITFKRLSKLVQTALLQGNIASPGFFETLLETDDHGLLGWCLGAVGKTVAPFSDWHRQYPKIWAESCHRFQQHFSIP